MLDVTGSSAAGVSGGPDFVARYRDSELLAANRKAIAAASEPVGAAPAVSGGNYAASYQQQLRALLGRQATRYWRLPQVGLPLGGQPQAGRLARRASPLGSRPRCCRCRAATCPQYNGIRMVVSLAFALVVGSLYWQQGQVPAVGGSTTNVSNIMGAAGPAGLQACWLPCTPCPAVALA